MELLVFSLAGVIVAATSWVPLFLIDAGSLHVSAAILPGVSDLAVSTQGRRLWLVGDVVDGPPSVTWDAVVLIYMTPFFVDVNNFWLNNFIVFELADG